jgi:hypothetical protein
MKRRLIFPGELPEAREGASFAVEEQKNRKAEKLIIIKCYQCGSTEYGDVTCHIGGGGKAPLYC